MSAGVALAKSIDSKALIGVSIPIGLIGDSALVYPLNDEVDHLVSWSIVMGLDIILTAIIVNQN